MFHEYLSRAISINTAKTLKFDISCLFRGSSRDYISPPPRPPAPAPPPLAKIFIIAEIFINCCLIFHYLNNTMSCHPKYILYVNLCLSVYVKLVGSLSPTYHCNLLVSILVTSVYHVRPGIDVHNKLCKLESPTSFVA